MPSALGCKRRTDYNGTFLAKLFMTPLNFFMGLGLSLKVKRQAFLDTLYAPNFGDVTPKQVLELRSGKIQLDSTGKTD
jgi:hypothetical protein